MLRTIRPSGVISRWATSTAHTRSTYALAPLPSLTLRPSPLEAALKGLWSGTSLTPYPSPPTVTFISSGAHNETRIVPIPESPTTLLELAKSQDIKIEAACGGQCNCTTCAVVIEQGKGRVPKPGERELDMLRMAGIEKAGIATRDIRRLGCQVWTDNKRMDGLIIRVEGRVGPAVRPPQSGEDGEDGGGGPMAALLMGKMVVSAAVLGFMVSRGYEYGDRFVGSEAGVTGAGLSCI